MRSITLRHIMLCPYLQIPEQHLHSFRRSSPHLPSWRESRPPSSDPQSSPSSYVSAPTQARDVRGPPSNECWRKGRARGTEQTILMSNVSPGARGRTHLSTVNPERRQCASIVLRNVVERVLHELRRGNASEGEQGVRNGLKAFPRAELIVRAEEVSFTPVGHLLRVAQVPVEDADVYVRDCRAGHAFVSERSNSTRPHQNSPSSMCTLAQCDAPSLRMARCPWCSADRT